MDYVRVFVVRRKIHTRQRDMLCFFSICFEMDILAIVGRWLPAADDMELGEREDMVL